MSSTTAIEWTDRVWNPIRGCSMVSAGCQNCYAMKQAHRFSGPGQPYEGLTYGPRWTGKIKLVPEALDAPLHWKKPRRIFVNSMSDLFHEEVHDKFIAAVFGVMAAAPQHTFQVLTKRPERMRQWFRWIESKRGGLTTSLVKHGGAWPKVDEYSAESVLCAYCAREVLEPLSKVTWAPWPLPNVWLGVSVENQATADERIPLLLETPAAVRFVSAEPLLGSVDFSVPWPPGWREQGDPQSDRFDGLRFDDRNSFARLGRLNWVIVGGESGPGARPCDVSWIRSIRDQCQKAGVPVFVKQLGAKPFVVEGSQAAQEWSASGATSVMDDCGGIHVKDKKGGDMAEWSEDLRVREFPGRKL
ncbi:MAG: phage Gp37/Gp68 family protein [Nitrospirota bacterium]|nr:phage Gp37/Gp68 family protein [Nitrospirota bacterium]